MDLSPGHQAFPNQKKSTAFKKVGFLKEQKMFSQSFTHL